MADTPAPEYTGTVGGLWTMKKAAERTRSFLRDTSAENFLDEGESQHSWERIYEALEDAISDWNMTPPVSAASVDSEGTIQIDPRANPLLVRRATATLLMSEANKQTRNQITFSDQGFSVSENDKGGAFTQMASQMIQEYNLDKTRLKALLNAADTWGGFHHHITGEGLHNNEY